MNKCPITYQDCEGKYSAEGLKRLSYLLTDLNDFPYSAEEQRDEAGARASKMSIQGVQPKLSVFLNIKKSVFEIIDKNGTYIIKPQSHLYKELPQNEDLTMKLAELVGIEIPLHGMIYSKDGSLSYFIKRFDRYRKTKIPLEDFAQLSGASRDTKYNSSMEKVAAIIEQYCTFPLIEKQKLFRLVVFNFILGNEDMHLKNYSLITRNDKIELSPAYDLLNSSIVLKNPEQIALPINGKKNNLTRKDIVEYFGKERLGLNEKTIINILEVLFSKQKDFDDLITRSFLSDEYKEKYRNLYKERLKLFE